MKKEYFVAEGEWRDGESFGIKLPCHVQALGLPDKDNVFAFMYGPVLLSANLGSENMIEGSTGVDVTIPAEKLEISEEIRVNNGDVKDFIKNINDHLLKDPYSLEFTLTGTDREMTFGPHYKKYNERYGIYWYFVD